MNAPDTYREIIRIAGESNPVVIPIALHNGMVRLQVETNEAGVYARGFVDQIIREKA